MRLWHCLWRRSRTSRPQRRASHEQRFGAVGPRDAPAPGMESNELRAEMKKTLDDLVAMRDEVRVRAHLLGMDLKDQWNKLEPKIGSADKLLETVSEASRDALSALA